VERLSNVHALDGSNAASLDETVPRCCPNTPIRKIARSVHEEARDVAREIGKTSEYCDSKR
jgi:hypothetical protein